MKRNSDNKLFAMKKIQIPGVEKNKLLKQEHLLLQLIDSDYVMKIEEIYEFNNKIYLLEEFMDGESLEKIIKRFHK